MIVLRPTGEKRPDLSGLGFVSNVLDARVVAARDVPCIGAEQQGVSCRRVTYELLEGPDRGRMFTQEFVGAGGTPRLEAGDGVVLAFDPTAQPEFRYRFVDRRRTGVILWLALLFALAVVALGRFRGLAALAGLAASLLVLIQFILPAILDGRNPVLVAVVGASAIAFVALYMAHGFSTMTTVALLGTVAGRGAKGRGADGRLVGGQTARASATAALTTFPSRTLTPERRPSSDRSAPARPSSAMRSA